jgi:aspartate/methionine/tyrosine aminotransferase
MRLEPFNLERIQSEWEHQVEFNLSESGVEPLRIRELLNTSDLREELLNTQLSYSQTNGTIPLREAIAQYYSGVRADSVLVTNGGAEANYLVNWWLYHENPQRHEFAFMIPNYMQMGGAWKTLGGTLRLYSLKMRKDGWFLDFNELKQAITDNTVAIALCNPNNPTGAILSEQDLREISRIAAERDLWIISDEIYRGAELKGEKAQSMHGIYEKTIITSSLSKAYGLPGLRIGWAVCPSAEVAKELWTYSDYTTICPSKTSDWLATLALQPDVQKAIEKRTREIIRENWRIVKNWLDARPDLFEYIPPAAAAICFIKQKTGLSSLDLTMRLLKEKSVLIPPGDYFEMPGFMRVGFGSDKEHLKQALERFTEFLEEL